MLGGSDWMNLTEKQKNWYIEGQTRLAPSGQERGAHNP